MKIPLQQLASIQTGVFARTSKFGDTVYIKVGHFDENGKLNTFLHPDLKSNHSLRKHLLNTNDILFASKGTKNFAYQYEDFNIPAVASTSFFVIRINESHRNKLLPEYLAWFINLPSSQKYLKDKAKGTNIVSISKTELNELEIPIPGIHSQKAILKISQLLSQEKQLKHEIEMLREKQIQQIILNELK